MISRKTISKLALMTVAVIALTLNGCSAILSGMGARSDASKPDQNLVPKLQVDTIEPGTTINVVFNDGSWLSGNYFGLFRIPAEQYAAIYFQAREQEPEGMILPALGDNIDIEKYVVGLSKDSEKKLEGTFEGFEHDRILIKLKGKARPSDVQLSTVTKIVGSQGHVISGETIKRLIREGKIPVLSTIVVEGEAEKTVVAMDKVSQIIIPVKKKGASTGFVFGAFIDVFVLLVIINSLGKLSLTP